MEIPIWSFVSVVAAIPCSLVLGWGSASFFANRRWDRRWDKWVADYKESTQQAFSTIRATSAEDKAKGDEIRDRAQVEIETLKAELSEASSEMKALNMIEPSKEEVHEKIRENLTIKTKEGRTLEPLLPGDYI